MFIEPSWENWPNSWHTSFLALQVNVEGHSLAGWRIVEHFGDLQKRVHPNHYIIQVKSVGKLLGFLSSLKRLVKIQSEIPYGNFQKSKHKESYVVNYHSRCTFVNNQAQSDDTSLICDQEWSFFENIFHQKRGDYRKEYFVSVENYSTPCQFIRL